MVFSFEKYGTRQTLVKISSSNNSNKNKKKENKFSFIFSLNPAQSRRHSLSGFASVMIPFSHLNILLSLCWSMSIIFLVSVFIMGSNLTSAFSLFPSSIQREITNQLSSNPLWAMSRISQRNYNSYNNFDSLSKISKQSQYESSSSSVKLYMIKRPRFLGAPNKEEAEAQEKADKNTKNNSILSRKKDNKKMVSRQQEEEYERLKQRQKDMDADSERWFQLQQEREKRGEIGLFEDPKFYVFLYVVTPLLIMGWAITTGVIPGIVSQPYDIEEVVVKIGKKGITQEYEESVESYTDSFNSFEKVTAEGKYINK